MEFRLLLPLPLSHRGPSIKLPSLIYEIDIPRMIKDSIKPDQHRLNSVGRLQNCTSCCYLPFFGFSFTANLCYYFTFRAHIRYSIAQNARALINVCTFSHSFGSANRHRAVVSKCNCAQIYTLFTLLAAIWCEL